MNLSQMKNNSLFDRSAVEKTQLVQRKVELIGAGRTITGYTKEPFKITMSNEYGQLFDSLPMADALAKIGEPSLQTGVFSKKYFKGGGDLDLKISFRVVEDGTSNTYKAIEDLLIMSSNLPFDTVKTLDKAIGKVKAQLIAAGGIVKGAFDSVTEGNASSLINAAYNYVNELSNGIDNRTVTFNYGTIFSASDMVVKDIDVTYSNEMTHSGPLFVDFSVGLISVMATIGTRQAE